MNSDPAPEQLEAEFPGWLVWQGVNRLWYARQPVTDDLIRGEDTVDLRDMIRRHLARAEDGGRA